MKTFAGLVAGLMAAYITLVLVVTHLDAAPAACGQAFTLPGLACRFAGFGLMLLLVPVAGVVAFVATRRLLTK
jgi:uncharacterized membrane protein YqjE